MKALQTIVIVGAASLIFCSAAFGQRSGQSMTVRQCAAAKQALVDAETDEAMVRAVRKIQILCYD